MVRDIPAAKAGLDLGNARNGLKTLLFPFLLCCMFYAVSVMRQNTESGAKSGIFPFSLDNLRQSQGKCFETLLLTLSTIANTA